MYLEWAPPVALRERIVCLWRSAADVGETSLVVPDACVDLIWSPHGPQVAGPDTGPFRVRLRPGDVYRGIRFRPGAVGGVLGVPIAELRDRRVPFADLGLPEDLTLDQLATRLRATPTPDPAASAMAEALRLGSSVREVAWELGVSERHLHRRCVAGFGYSPKTLQRIVRFQRALRLARRGMALAEVAAVSGYADQAHLSNDVKRLSGVPMGKLIRP
ncbi:helix-turn-helix transcriptional regulator [Nonomuraea sp. NPDC046570]|uniref:helix-turn-helix domain-containing protein n=1 Tax=Nonomuraea sp. NPDC046570 TaxID=3155255 RepID=UPI003408D57F